VLVILLILAVIGLAMGVPDPDFVEQDRSADPPADSRVTGGPAATPGLARRFRTGETEIPVAAPGRIVLDLSMGEFEVEAGLAGEPIRIEASYDQGSYELEESFDPGGRNGWEYRVEFGRSIAMFRQVFGPKQIRNRVRIVIPRDLPFELEAELGLGESRLRLGGLWLVAADLQFGAGDHGVSFDEPTPVPLELFRADGSAGELRFSDIGNASPREVSITLSVGDSTVDLGGAWSVDSEVRISQGLGALAVRLPDDDVAVVLERARVMIGERRVRRSRERPEPPEEAPTVQVDVSSLVGEVRVD
jgi:hypothetical protein